MADDPPDPRDPRDPLVPDPPPAVRDVESVRSAASRDYQQQVDDLRARGCRCTLQCQSGRAVPLWPHAGETCAVLHSED